MKPPKYPRLTGLRALRLLRELDYRAGVRAGQNLTSESGLESARREIADHLRAVVVKGSK